MATLVCKTCFRDVNLNGFLHSLQKTSSTIHKRGFRFSRYLQPTPEEVAQIREELHAPLKPLPPPSSSPTPWTNEEVRKNRSQLFTQEQKRQRELVGRIEKIQVSYEGQPENATLIMNKGISTPYNCAQHMSEMVMKRYALAEVNGELWDMHKPLESDCTLRLLHFKSPDPQQLNRAFWRSCSFMLGAVVEKAFQDQFFVELLSFPSPNIRSGSFVYDVDLKMDKWNPTGDELRILSSQMVRLARAELPFERLEVDASVALEMFLKNKFKKEQIPHIAAQSESGNTVILYRIGDHVDVSKGPMISNTAFLGRCSIVAAHHMNSQYGSLYRFQGVAIPAGFLLNHYAYGLLEQRAQKLNPHWLPGVPDPEKKSSEAE